VRVLVLPKISDEIEELELCDDREREAELLDELPELEVVLPDPGAARSYGGT